MVSITSGEPKAKAEKDRIPEETLGIPDYDGNDNYLTLGCGGVSALAGNLTAPAAPYRIAQSLILNMFPSGRNARRTWS